MVKITNEPKHNKTGRGKTRKFEQPFRIPNQFLLNQLIPKETESLFFFYSSLATLAISMTWFIIKFGYSQFCFYFLWASLQWTTIFWFDQPVNSEYIHGPSFICPNIFNLCFTQFYSFQNVYWKSKRRINKQSTINSKTDNKFYFHLRAIS